MSRRRRRCPERITTVGILSCATIGDAIVASAIARDIRHAWPDCRVVAFVAPACRGLTDLVLGYDAEVALSVTSPARALRVLRRHPTDVLIDPSQWPRITAILAALAPTRFTVGFRTSGAHRHYAYDATVLHSAACHEVENFRALLHPLGITGTSLPRAAPHVAAPASCRTPAFIVFHPWASGYRSHLREWDPGNWVALGRHVLKRGARIVITGGPGDRDRAEALAGRIGAPGCVRVLAGEATLAQTAGCLAEAAAVVAVNTGTMHLAAALDRPMIALHGPTDPRRWGPLSNAAIVLGPGREQGGAYLHLGFEYPRTPPDCMGRISVGEVAAALDRTLGWQDASVA
jgi:heptosyltransferase-3